MLKSRKPAWLAPALPYLYVAAGILIIALPDHEASTVTGVVVMTISGVVGVLLILLGIIAWEDRRRRLRKARKEQQQR